MSDEEERHHPVSAASLRETAEWLERPDGTELLWEDGADEGTPHGYDLLDRSAFVGGYFRSVADWAEVAAFYRQRLAGLGWTEREVIGAPAGVALFERHPGESLMVINRPERSGMWAPPNAYDGPGTLFEVNLKHERR